MSYDSLFHTRFALRHFDYSDVYGSTRSEGDFCTLTAGQSCDTKATLSGFDTLGLENGRSYLVRLRPRSLWWSYKTKEEILGPTGRKEETSLPYVTPIPIICPEEVRFRMVAQ